MLHRSMTLHFSFVSEALWRSIISLLVSLNYYQICNPIAPYIFLPCLIPVLALAHFAELSTKGKVQADLHDNMLPVGIELVNGIHAGASCAAAVLRIL